MPTATFIENAAKEPEIEDLADALNEMGGRVRGAGTDIVQIDGVDSLHGLSHEIIPDRIEAGSFVIASAITGGDVWIKDARRALRRFSDQACGSRRRPDIR